MNRIIRAFISGTHNKLSSELIPKDAASNSYGWLTRDGKIELMYGRDEFGQTGGVGRNNGEHTGFKTDGTQVRFRKTSNKVQYFDGSIWQDVITGLSNSDVFFTNYSSLAGNFVYVSSPQDGLFKIVTANPDSYTDVYNSSKNFKGYFFIDKGRSIMWRTENDKTGLYGSYIDAQDSSVYTTITAESIGASGSTNYTGTLAFKSAGATRTCFGVSFTDGATTLTVDFTGVVTGDGSGTVNFTTGAYNITFNSATVGTVTSDYQYEDSNSKGVTDFTKSAVRQAGEGFVLRQDKGGDEIKTVLVLDGSYFSMKGSSVYRLTLDTLDTNPTNELIRSGVGVETLRSAVSTGAGIIFINTADKTNPKVEVISKNIAGDNFNVKTLFTQFDFSKYSFSDAVVLNWDKYVVIGCSEGTNDNNRLLMCNIDENVVDVAYYNVRTLDTDKNGVLYGGDPLSETTYKLFDGFDDVGNVSRNSWISADSTYSLDSLKRVKRLRFKGKISPNQSIKVSISTDGGDFKLVGTILGSADYVSYNTSYAIGTSLIGADNVGGGNDAVVYDFFMEMKIRVSKFRNRRIKFEAQGFGYCSIQEITDFDIWTYQDKLPKHLRSKQNVSLDGLAVDQSIPTY